MDREAKEEYHVVIQAKDMGGHMGGLSGTTKVTITLTDVNDNPPKFPQSKESELVFANCHCSVRSSYSHSNLPNFQKEESRKARTTFRIFAQAKNDITTAYKHTKES